MYFKKNFSFDITETCSEIGKARLAACSYDYIINETWLMERAYLHLPPAAYTPLKFRHDNRKQFHRLYKVFRQILCAPAGQAPVERLFSISGYILSQRRLRTNHRNFENILFANVKYDIFDMELRKRKQPDSDSDNQWWSKDLSKYSTFAVMKSGLVLKKR